MALLDNIDPSAEEIRRAWRQSCRDCLPVVVLPSLSLYCLEPIASIIQHPYTWPYACTHKHTQKTHIGCAFPGGGICPMLLKLDMASKDAQKPKLTNMTFTLTHLSLSVSLFCVHVHLTSSRTLNSTRWTWKETTKASASACGEEESTTWTCTCWGLLKKELQFAMGKWGYGHLIAEAPDIDIPNQQQFPERGF